MAKGIRFEMTKIEKRDCPRCNGRGIYQRSYFGPWRRCEKCNGTGEISTTKNETVTLPIG